MARIYTRLTVHRPVRLWGFRCRSLGPGVYTFTGDLRRAFLRKQDARLFAQRMVEVECLIDEEEIVSAQTQSPDALSEDEVFVMTEAEDDMPCSLDLNEVTAPVVELVADQKVPDAESRLPNPGQTVRQDSRKSRKAR